MTDLADLVPSLQRAVAPPGQFDALYPSAGSNDLLGLLMDALAETVLDGFWFGVSPQITWTDDGITTPDLDRGQQALVVIYAATTFLRTVLQQQSSTTRYKAGPVEYEVQTGASVTAQLLKDLATRKQELIDRVANTTASTAFYMADLYLANAVESFNTRWFDLALR